MVFGPVKFNTTNIGSTVGSNIGVISSVNKDNAKTSIPNIFCEYKGKSPAIKSDEEQYWKTEALKHAKEDFGTTLNYVQGNGKEEPYFEFTTPGQTINILVNRYHLPKDSFKDREDEFRLISNGPRKIVMPYAKISAEIFQKAIGCDISCLQNQN